MKFNVPHDTNATRQLRKELEDVVLECGCCGESVASLTGVGTHSSGDSFTCENCGAEYRLNLSQVTGPSIRRPFCPQCDEQLTGTTGEFADSMKCYECQYEVPTTDDADEFRQYYLARLVEDHISSKTDAMNVEKWRLSDGASYVDDTVLSPLDTDSVSIPPSEEWLESQFEELKTFEFLEQTPGSTF